MGIITIESTQDNEAFIILRAQRLRLLKWTTLSKKWAANNNNWNAL